MIEVLFENEDVVVVNKPEGISAIPERQKDPPPAESLFEWLCAQRGEEIFIVHRIDKGTSGVILYARNAEAHRRLSLQFQQRIVQKEYLALVHGVVAADEGAIDKPLGQRGSGRVSVSPQSGRESYTEYRVLHRFAAYTLVEAYPRTGRRHQIRVHFYSLGHAIVGDRLYGDVPLQRTYPRMMLHAQRLTIRLPNGQMRTFEAPPPSSFERVLQRADTS